MKRAESLSLALQFSLGEAKSTVLPATDGGGLTSGGLLRLVSQLPVGLPQARPTATRLLLFGGGWAGPDLELTLATIWHDMIWHRIRRDKKNIFNSKKNCNRHIEIFEHMCEILNVLNALHSAYLPALHNLLLILSFHHTWHKHQAWGGPSPSDYPSAFKPTQPILNATVPLPVWYAISLQQSLRKHTSPSGFAINRSKQRGNGYDLESDVCWW